MVVVVFGGTSYELSTYAKVNSGTEGVGDWANAELIIIRLDAARTVMSSRVAHLLMLYPCNN